MRAQRTAAFSAQRMAAAAIWLEASHGATHQRKRPAGKADRPSAEVGQLVVVPPVMAMRVVVVSVVMPPMMPMGVMAVVVAPMRVPVVAPVVAMVVVAMAMSPSCLLCELFARLSRFTRLDGGHRRRLSSKSSSSKCQKAADYCRNHRAFHALFLLSTELYSLCLP